MLTIKKQTFNGNYMAFKYNYIENNTLNLHGGGPPFWNRLNLEQSSFEGNISTKKLHFKYINIFGKFHLSRTLFYLGYMNDPFHIPFSNSSSELINQLKAYIRLC
jgi:hypothetical protein